MLKDLLVRFKIGDTEEKALIALKDFLVDLKVNSSNIEVDDRDIFDNFNNFEFEAYSVEDEHEIEIKPGMILMNNTTAGGFVKILVRANIFLLALMIIEHKLVQITINQRLVDLSGLTDGNSNKHYVYCMADGIIDIDNTKPEKCDSDGIEYCSYCSNYYSGITIMPAESKGLFIIKNSKNAFGPTVTLRTNKIPILNSTEDKKLNNLIWKLNAVMFG